MSLSEIRDTIFVGELSSDSISLALYAYEQRPFTPFRGVGMGIEISHKIIHVSPLKSWYTWEMHHTRGLTVESIFNLCNEKRELLHNYFANEFPIIDTRFLFSCDWYEKKKPVSVVLCIGCVRRIPQLSLVLGNAPSRGVKNGHIIPLSDR